MHESDPLPIVDSFGSKNHEGTTRATAALCVAATVVGTIGTVTLPFIVMPWVRGQNLPYMATPKGKLQKAFNFLSLYRPERPSTCMAGNQRFVDLGSGDGETVYQALQMQTSMLSASRTDNLFSSSDVKRQPFYFSHCTGIELNSTLYMWSCVRRFFWSRDAQRRSRFLCRNLFFPDRHLLEDATTVFIFGIPSLMTPISQLLRRHCRPGTFILCYRFPLPVADKASDQDVETNGGKLLPAQLIYDHEEMRIYECIVEKKLVHGVDDLDKP